jgi:hypothetical protein
MSPQLIMKILAGNNQFKEVTKTKASKFHQNFSLGQASKYIRFQIVLTVNNVSAEFLVPI